MLELQLPEGEELQDCPSAQAIHTWVSVRIRFLASLDRKPAQNAALGVKLELAARVHARQPPLSRVSSQTALDARRRCLRLHREEYLRRAQQQGDAASLPPLQSLDKDFEAFSEEAD